VPKGNDLREKVDEGDIALVLQTQSDRLKSSANTSDIPHEVSDANIDALAINLPRLLLMTTGYNAETIT
jgi:hypothetical protein